MMRKVSIIGAGRVGGALALALAKSGYRIGSLVYRSSANVFSFIDLISPKPQVLSFENLSQMKDEEIIFITTQDAQIAEVVEKLRDSLESSPIVFHTGGSLSSEILQGLKEKNCQIGSLHPLVSISDSQIGGKRFEGAYFCLEGDAEAVKVGREIVEALNGKPFTISAEMKPLYHASAVTACGHLTALFSVALEMLSTCGLSPEASREILLPLVKSTVENWETQTPAEALTGTFARADAETLKKHLSIIDEKLSPETSNIYRLLGVHSLKLAEKQGVSREKLLEMEKLLLKKVEELQL